MIVANSNQSRSASIRAPNFYLICQFVLYLFVGICILALFVSVYLCPRDEDAAADFSRWASVFPFLHKVVLGFRIRRCSPYKIFTEISARLRNPGGQNLAKISARFRNLGGQNPAAISRNLGGQNPAAISRNLGGQNPAEISKSRRPKSCRDLAEIPTSRRPKSCCESQSCGESSRKDAIVFK